MTDQRERIVAMLSSMRMSKMAEAFLAQLDSPQALEMPFIDRLESLVVHEYESRRHNRKDKLFKASHMIWPMADFNGLRVDKERGIDPAQIGELKDCSWMLAEGHPGMLITGPTGSGKSYLAHCFGHVACERGIPVSLPPHP